MYDILANIENGAKAAHRALEADADIQEFMEAFVTVGDLHVVEDKIDEFSKQANFFLQNVNEAVVANDHRFNHVENDIFNVSHAFLSRQEFFDSLNSFVSRDYYYEGLQITADELKAVREEMQHYHKEALQSLPQNVEGVANETRQSLHTIEDRLGELSHRVSRCVSSEFLHELQSKLLTLIDKSKSDYISVSAFQGWRERHDREMGEMNKHIGKLKEDLQCRVADGVHKEMGPGVDLNAQVKDMIQRLDSMHTGLRKTQQEIEGVRELHDQRIVQVDARAVAAKTLFDNLERRLNSVHDSHETQLNVFKREVEKQNIHMGQRVDTHNCTHDSLLQHVDSVQRSMSKLETRVESVEN